MIEEQYLHLPYLPHVLLIRRIFYPPLPPSLHLYPTKKEVIFRINFYSVPIDGAVAFAFKFTLPPPSLNHFG